MAENIWKKLVSFGMRRTIEGLKTAQVTKLGADESESISHGRGNGVNREGMSGRERRPGVKRGYRKRARGGDYPRGNCRRERRLPAPAERAAIPSHTTRKSAKTVAEPTA